MIKTYIKQISAVFLFLIATSCESDKLEAELDTADGGGTLTSYIAYTIESTDPTGTNVSGRIVFWKTSIDQTLVQISLDSPNYETMWEASTTQLDLAYPSSIMTGAIGDETLLTDLYDVEVFQLVTQTDSDAVDTDDYDRDGNTTEDLPTQLIFYAEFAVSKFFVISDTNFYDSILDLDGHINIYDTDGTTIIAAGNIGTNEDPVEQN